MNATCSVIVCCAAACAMWTACAGAAAAPESDERLARRLEWFADLRFGLFLHWGPYSQLGCIESWPLVWADRAWSNPSIKTFEEMLEFRKKYFALNRTFDPAQFDPKSWAAAAKRAGMKYVMFTTKHHDGFCMFDTRQTDYRITHPDCPYSRRPNPDITRAVFSAFRDEGFGIGCYFSKSDWHHPCYWDPSRRAEDRNPNYDTAAEPQRWAQFVRFVHAQVEELMSNYGRIDILWLDGGQVRPPKQDIQMDRLAEMARRHQPDLIIVDRTAGTRHENYRTPEQEVPEKPLPYAWESCITMGTQWSYKPDDKYKSPRELIHLLVDVVAKGGNLLLNIGPQPDGRLPEPALQRLEAIGRWMAVNAEAIHASRPLPPWKDGQVAFTRRGDTVYAIYLFPEGSSTPPAQVRFTGPRPADGATVRLLGFKDAVRWRMDGQSVVIDVPPEAVASPPSEHAVVFAFASAK